MADREKKGSETGEIQNKIALAMAKREARSELKRILDEELNQRRSETQHSLSRPATASHSHS